MSKSFTSLAVQVFTILALVHLSYGLYNSNSPVVKLTKANWQKKVMDSDALWLVEFYAPWCGHCKSLAPEWEKAAKVLKGIIKVGAVDMDTDQEVGQPYGIQGFPTIKFFGSNKNKPKAYESGRDTNSIVSYAMQQAQSEVNSRLSGKSSGSGGKKSKKSGGGSKGTFTDGDVVILTDANFDEMVMKSKDIWFIEFYAPWCGHCKALAPEWNEAATTLKGQIKMGKVDCTVEKQLGSRFGVKGYPTLKIWDYGTDKTDASSQEYSGARNAEGIVKHASYMLDKADIEPEIIELTDQKVYDSECKNSKGVCFISFLPNIYDSNAKERNKYISVIKKVAKKNRSQPIKFFWLSAGDQLDFERDFNLGFGFPAVLTISPLKKRYVIMRSSFSEKSMKGFLTSLMVGKEKLEELKIEIKLKKADSWDGKDAPPMEEESYDTEEKEEL